MTDINKPLLGDIRVIELATMVFAPSACVVLADFGAEVIKVEPLNGGDLNREYHKLPGMPISDLPYTFQMDNRNKKSIALNLKSEKGYEALCKLLAEADVFVSNLRPKALARLKLDFESLQTINPRLIAATATGYGEHGEEKDKPGYDNVCYWSRSGIDQHVFPYESWLNAFPFGAGDHPSGMSLFAAIMTGLYQRKETGKGCKVSTSLLANGAWANATMLQAQLCDATFQQKRPRAQAYNFTNLHYRSKDNRLLRLGIVNLDKDWEAFCQAIARPDLIDDTRFADDEGRAENMPLLISQIDQAFAAYDMSHWQKTFDKYDMPYAVLPTYEEAANDQQKEDNDIIVPLSHPRYGQIRTINSPFEVSGYQKSKPTAAPLLGEHSREVLSELGYSDDEINQLIEEGITQGG